MLKAKSKVKSKVETENITVEIQDPSVPKKRGRKPKECTESVSSFPKKRGRKPKEKGTDSVIIKKVKKQKEAYGLVISQKEISVRELDNPILFLDLKPSDTESLEKSFFEYDVTDYDPELHDPSPYDPGNENYHPLKGDPETMIQNEVFNKNKNNTNNKINDKPSQEDEDKFQKLINQKTLNQDEEKLNFLSETSSKQLFQGTEQQPTQSNNTHSSLNKFQKYYPMMDLYMETNQRDTWPTRSEYNCLWDFESFNTTPWGIPYKYENDKFYARPNFCSPGCAAGYLFQHYDDDDVWEKYSLLNMLFQKVINDPTKNVIPAPDPECLNVNGGFLDLDEFRTISWQGNKEFILQMPPMVALTPTAKIQDTGSSLSDNMGPIYKQRIQEATDELRYRRTKPLTDRNNSLHHYFDSIRAEQS